MIKPGFGIYICLHVYMDIRFKTSIFVRIYIYHHEYKYRYATVRVHYTLCFFLILSSLRRYPSRLNYCCIILTQLLSPIPKSHVLSYLGVLPLLSTMVAYPSVFLFSLQYLSWALDDLPLDCTFPSFFILDISECSAIAPGGHFLSCSCRLACARVINANHPIELVCYTRWKKVDAISRPWYSRTTTKAFMISQ